MDEKKRRKKVSLIINLLLVGKFTQNGLYHCVSVHDCRTIYTLINEPFIFLKAWLLEDFYLVFLNGI